MPGYRRIRFVLLFLLLMLLFGVHAVYAKDRSAYDEPNFQIEIGECTWNGTKSITQVTFILTNTRVEIYQPTGSFFRLTMSRPVVTVGLESGEYKYIWLDDYDPTFYVWLKRVEGSFTLDECQPKASASVSVGTCAWTETSGSVTPVTITLDHASLTLNGTTYTAAQTIISDLAPGSYPYSWMGTGGYEGGESNLPLVIPDCTPEQAIVKVEPGACGWDEVNGSITDVALSITGASLMLTGPSGTFGAFTSNTSIPLEQGYYNYAWVAQNGYSGSGTGSFTLVDCEPKIGTASIEAGACSWDEAKGSTFVATITLDNATLTINGVTYQESTTVELACGTYAYTWAAKPGFQGGGLGSITVEGCEPASVDVIVGACDWTGSTSMTSVSLDITGATLTVFDTTSGSPVQIGQYGPGTHSLSLPAGSYSYSWEANENFTGSGSDTFDTINCEPGKADASVNIGACAFDDGKSLTLVTINVSGAILTIDGEDYDENAEVKLEPGSYYYSWTAVAGYEGSGNGTINIEGCEPASVDVVLGTCDWIEETSLTPVTLDINGATLTLFSDDGGTLTQIDEFSPGSHAISLPMGSYAYSWVANENFTGSGEGTFDTFDCEPGKADATIILGACTYDNEQSLTLVSIFVNGAVLTIHGQDYFEYAEIKLEPGDYPYSWVAASKEFEGGGKGVLTVGSCDPKSSEDPSPDVAAGGSGPTAAPIMTCIVLFLAVFSPLAIKINRTRRQN